MRLDAVRGVMLIQIAADGAERGNGYCYSYGNGNRNGYGGASASVAAGGFGESQALQKAAGRLEACATERARVICGDRALRNSRE